MDYPDNYDPMAPDVPRTITLEELRRSTATVPAPPLTGEPTDAHDRAVQAALYSRAVGYTRRKEHALKSGEIVELREEMPPDPSAAARWLQARRPEAWADKRTQEFRVIVARLGESGPQVSRIIEHELAQAVVENLSGPGEGAK